MSWTNDTIGSGSYSKDTKPSLSDSFLLKEDTFYLLLESGFKILLQNSVSFSTDPGGLGSWANDTL